MDHSRRRRLLLLLLTGEGHGPSVTEKKKKKKKKRMIKGEARRNMCVGVEVGKTRSGKKTLTPKQLGVEWSGPTMLHT